MRKTVLTALLILMTVTLTVVPVLASGDAGHGADSGAVLKDFLYRIFDFAVVAAILIFFLKKPIQKGLKGRTEEIENALAEAKEAKEQAEQKFAEYDRKLSLATEEIAEIGAAIRREGELEKEKIIAEAKVAAEQIERDAGKAAENEIARAKAVLQRQAAELSVGLAEEMLKKNINKDDDKRLIDEYMSRLGE